MTIGGWVIFSAAVLIAIVASIFVCCEADHTSSKILCISICCALIVGVWFGLHWYYNNTASGQRELIDQRSDLEGGIDRTVTVYTADGTVLAKYQGKIDLAENDGGYIKFDFEGKRYIYYNCFVESIADIEGK